MESICQFTIFALGAVAFPHGADEMALTMPIAASVAQPVAPNAPSAVTAGGVGYNVGYSAVPSKPLPPTRGAVDAVPYPSKAPETAPVAAAVTSSALVMLSASIAALNLPTANSKVGPVASDASAATQIFPTMSGVRPANETALAGKASLPVSTFTTLTIDVVPISAYPTAIKPSAASTLVVAPDNQTRPMPPNLQPAGTQ